MDENERQILEAIFNQNEFIMRQNQFIICNMDAINKAVEKIDQYCYNSIAYRQMMDKTEKALRETDEVRMQLSISKPGRFL